MPAPPPFPASSPLPGPVGRQQTIDGLVGRLGPTLQVLEGTRRRHLARGLGYGALAGAAFGAGGLLVAGSPLLAALAAVGVGGLACWGGLDGARAAYARAFKARVVTALAGWLAPSMAYEAATVQLREAAKASGFLPEGHAYTHSEDLMHGTFEGSRAAFCELRATTHDHDDEGGEGHLAGAFEGLLFRVGLDAPVPDHVVLLPAAARMGKGAAAYAGARPGGGSPVTLDDPAFHGAFQAFARDPGVARALLRPGTRDRLVALAGDRPLFAAWREGWFYLGVPRRGRWLEPSLWRPATARAQVERLAGDLYEGLELLRGAMPLVAGLAGGEGAVGSAAPAGPVGPSDPA